MIKVYGIYGRTTALIQIKTRSGRAHIDVEFKRGRLGLGKNDVPAKYSTDDPTVQNIIEDSPMFGGLIRLIEVYPGDAASSQQKAPEKKAEKKAAESVAAPEVTTREQAVTYLKARGAKAVQLRDDEAIMNAAAKFGVSFPNLAL